MGRAEFNRWLILSVSSIVGLTGSTSYAQSINAGDIIVTARRTEERLQDVPISITVLNQEQIHNRNVTTASDLATYTPSLSANSNFGSQNTTFAIRGFVQEIGTPPSVGVYFADVVAPRAAASNVPVGNGATPGDFFDLQNIQVLKGPQGTLFGRNTTGGAVLFVPQRPTYELEGYIEGSYGNHDMKRFQGVINVPLADTLRLRLGFDHMDRDGYIQNTTGVGPNDFQDVNYTALRASIIADLTPDLENYLIGTYIKTKDNGALQKMIACDSSSTRNGQFNLLGLGLACPALARTVGDGFYTAQNTLEDPYSKTEQFRFINTTTWRASDTVTVKNIASYSQFQQRARSMLFGTGFDTADLSPIVSGLASQTAGMPINIQVPSYLIPFSVLESLPNRSTSEQWTFTDELQIQGTSAGGKLAWQAGAYYETSSPLSAGGAQTPVLIHCTDVATFQCTDVGALYLGTPIGQISYSSTRESFRSIGLYSQATYELTEQLKFTGGIRYTWDRNKATGTIAGFAFPTPNNPVRFCTIPSSITNDCSVSYTAKSQKPTWVVSLDFTPVQDLLLYAKYARGYRAGGLSLQSPPQIAVFDPEKVDTYEVGMKTSFRGRISGNLNIAGFYNDFSNQQLQLNLVALPPNRGNATGIVNAGRSRMYGVEVDGSLTPFTGFSIDGSYAYLNTSIREIALPSLPASGGYTLDTQSVLAGDPLPLSPKHKLTVTGTYTLPLDEEIGKVSVGATFTYMSSQLSNYASRLVANAPTIQSLSYLKARSLLNLNFNWREVAGTPVDLALFATNVTKKKYYAYIPGLGRSVPFETAVLSEPKMYGVRLRYSFGR